MRVSCFATCVRTAVGAYAHKESYVGADFFSKWTFFTGPDPTKGFVEYVSKEIAEGAGLAEVTSDGVLLKSDDQGFGGRRSVRITSKREYSRGLFVASIDHMPTGCGAWPAFWMFGEDAQHAWPRWGEYDIIEGVHRATKVMTSLHTGPGCDQAEHKVAEVASPFSGTWAAGPLGQASKNCNINAKDEWHNQGCSQFGPEASMGRTFNNQGGGTFAGEWDPDHGHHIKTWFWPRGTEPADVAERRQLDPRLWGRPFSYFSLANSVCTKKHFAHMRLVFDLTFCGDLGGATFARGCPGYNMTCSEYVARNPRELAEAFWLIHKLDVYQQGEEVKPVPVAPVQQVLPPLPPLAPTIAPSAPERSTPQTHLPTPHRSHLRAVPILPPTPAPSSRFPPTPVPSSRFPRAPENPFMYPHADSRHSSASPSASVYTNTYTSTQLSSTSTSTSSSSTSTRTSVASTTTVTTALPPIIVPVAPLPTKHARHIPSSWTSPSPPLLSKSHRIPAWPFLLAFLALVAILAGGLLVVVTGRVKWLRACLAGLEENLVQVCSAEDTSDSSSEEDEAETSIARKNSASMETCLVSNSRPHRQASAPDFSVRQVSARRFKDERTRGRGSDNTSSNGGSVSEQLRSPADALQQLPQHLNILRVTAAPAVVAEHNGESQLSASQTHHQVTQPTITAPQAPIEPTVSMNPVGSRDVGAWDYHMRYSQHVSAPASLQPSSPAYSLAPTIPAFPFSATSSPPTTPIPFTGH